METVTYPYNGKHAVKNNDEARARAKHEIGPQVLISRIGWDHENGETRCVVEYLTEAEAADHDRAPNARRVVHRHGCTPDDVYNALIEMGGNATVHDVALALDLDVQWLTKQMERPFWQQEVGSHACFCGENTELAIDITTARYRPRSPEPQPRRAHGPAGVLASLFNRSARA